MEEKHDEINMDAFEHIPLLVYDGEEVKSDNRIYAAYEYFRSDFKFFNMLTNNDVAWFFLSNLIHDDRRLNTIETGFGDHWPYPYLFTLKDRPKFKRTNCYSMFAEKIAFMSMRHFIRLYMLRYDNMHDLWDALTTLGKLPPVRKQLLDIINKDESLRGIYKSEVIDYRATQIMFEELDLDDVIISDATDANKARYILKIARAAFGEGMFKLFQKRISKELKQLMNRISRYITLTDGDEEKWTKRQLKLVMDIEELADEKTRKEKYSPDFKITVCANYIRRVLHDMNPFTCPYDTGTEQQSTGKFLLPLNMIGKQSKISFIKECYNDLMAYVTAPPRHKSNNHGKYTYSYCRNKIRQNMATLGCAPLEDLSGGVLTFPIKKHTKKKIENFLRYFGTIKKYYERTILGGTMKAKKCGFVDIDENGKQHLNRENIAFSLRVAAGLACLCHNFYLVMAYNKSKDRLKEHTAHNAITINHFLEEGVTHEFGY